MVGTHLVSSGVFVCVAGLREERTAGDTGTGADAHWWSLGVLSFNPKARGLSGKDIASSVV